MRICLALLTAGALSLPAIASAQSVSTEEIIRHFKGSAEAAKIANSPISLKGGDGGGNSGGVKVPGTGGAKARGLVTRQVTICAACYDKKRGGVVVDATTRKKAAARADAAYNLLVTFEHNSADLTKQARENLSKFARALASPELKAMRFVVEGHTDSFGTDDYNLSLSVRRANAVVRFLTAMGINRARLVPKGFGESRPARKDGRHKDNRRVETRLLH